MKIPHTQPSKIPLYEKPSQPSDLRIRHLLPPYGGEAVQVGLLGAPSDLGVVQGGGRAGASLGPDAIRSQLKRYGTAYHFERQSDLSTLALADFGDLIVDEKSVERTHQRLTEAVAEIVGLGALPILIGGGHDLTFGGVHGLALRAEGAMGGIVIDAHFDVRKAVKGHLTSGTPFWNILEKIDGVRGDRFVEIGGNGLVNAKAHFDYLLEKKARIFSLSEVQRVGIGAVMEKALQAAGRRTEKIFFSIDLDAVAQAFAPGVSAPSPEGLTPEEVSHAAYLAGLHPKVAYLDIMEMSPNFDHDGRTARLAAALILHFLSGVAQRAERRKRKIGFRGGMR